MKRIQIKVQHTFIISKDFTWALFKTWISPEGGALRTRRMLSRNPVCDQLSGTAKKREDNFAYWWIFVCGLLVMDSKGFFRHTTSRKSLIALFWWEASNWWVCDKLWPGKFIGRLGNSGRRPRAAETNYYNVHMEEDCSVFTELP